ncbi:MAG: hypothetical protein KKD44_11480 [Proteobacteria bacterium]|nr:hypothetical protein [Pseudomonadota bacterium]
MKKTTANTLGIAFISTILAVACSAQVCFSDSFVDESVINATKDFTFGRCVQTVDKTDAITAHNNANVMENGDSFVNASVVEALNGFTFGKSDYSISTKRADATKLNAGDSFVNESVIRQLEGMSLSKLTLTYAN